MSKEAMKLALEALDMMIVPRSFQAQVRIKEIYEALAEALAKQEQGEPDVIMHPHHGTWTVINTPPKGVDDVALYYAKPTHWMPIPPIEAAHGIKE